MKKKKKHDKIVLWGKDNLNAIDASYINYDEFLFSKCPKRIEWDFGLENLEVVYFPRTEVFWNVFDK